MANKNNKSSGFTKAPARKAPDGMLMLRSDGANIIDWINENGIKLESEYGDIANFIRDGKDYPQRNVMTMDEIAIAYPVLTTPAQRNSVALKNVENNMKQLQRDRDNKQYIYAKLEACVTIEGFDRVSRMNGFRNTVTAQGDKDPKALLDLIIAEHTLKADNVSDTEAKYNARNRYNNIKMLAEQSLTDYTKAFDRMVTNMTALGVDPLPTEEERVYQFFARLDARRYGSYQNYVINALRRGEQHALPNTIQGVIDAARMHVPVTATGPSGGMSAGNNKSNPMVFATASQPQQPSVNISTSCQRCGGKNHDAMNCMTSAEKVKAFKLRQKNGPTANVMHLEAIDQDIDNDVTKTVEMLDEDTSEGMFINYSLNATAMNASYSTTGDQFIDANNKTRKVHIDTLANKSFVCNKELLSNIREMKTNVKGVHGTEQLTEAGDLPMFGEALYAPNAGVNGLAMNELERNFNVSYEQGVAFTISRNDGLLLVFEYDNELDSYACEFTTDVINNLRELAAREYYPHMYVSTTRQNESKYTTREVKGAQMAREMMRRMYYPSDSALIRTLTKGAMIECPVTAKDVVTATEIYGKDVASLKGKTKDKGPVGDYKTLVPKMERMEQIVYGDVFHWRDVSFILYIAKPLDMLFAQWLPKSNLENMIKATQSVYNRILARGYECSEIVVDPAKELTYIIGKVPFNVTTVGSRTHVAEAEVQIRTVKERLRASTQGLPFNVPKGLVRWQVYGIVYSLNLTLKKDQTVSSRELFTGIKPSYKRDFRAEFGEYVQAHVPPGEMLTRTGKERSVGAIALCSADNDRGTWWFMNIKVGSTFKADRWTTLPAPDIVIEKLNQMYDYQETKHKAKRQGEKRHAVSHPIDQPTTDEEGPHSMIRLPHERQTIPERVESATDDMDIQEIDTGCDIQETDTGSDTVTDEEQPVCQISNDENGVEEPQSQTLTTTAGPTERIIDTIPTEELGAKFIGGRRHSQRINAQPQRTQKYGAHIHRLTVKKALAENEEQATIAIEKELTQMVEKKVWSTIKKPNLTGKQIKNSIRSSMFLKKKYSASGEFEKLKARLVAGGDMQDKGIYESVSSPTVAQETVMTVLAIAAIENRKVATVDITGAYLECTLPEYDEVIMTLDPILSAMLVKLDPTITHHLDRNGTLYVRLNRALYGCVQSSRLWYDKLCKVLEEDGYTKNNYDPCLFNKMEMGEQVSVAFHVDDLLVTSKSNQAINKFMDMLKKSFKEITINTGDSHSYLSMNINLDSKGIHIDMCAYIDKCLEEKQVTVRHTSPAGDDLFNIDESSKRLDENQRKLFHSDVAKLMYLAKRTRAQILTAVSHLASRVANPNEDDQKKLMRVLGYLKRTRDEVMHLRHGGRVEPQVYIDASFGVHADGTSRTGVCIQLAGASIASWSNKQKLVTKSSTEAEVVGLSDGLTSALWMRELLDEQGHRQGAMKVFQDNQGVISIMRTGRSPKHRTRHLNIRHFFARDRMISGEIELEYKKTCEMIADLLTKPVTGALFKKLSAMSMGQENDDQNAGWEVVKPRGRGKKRESLPQKNPLNGLFCVLRGTISGV